MTGIWCYDFNSLKDFVIVSKHNIDLSIRPWRFISRSFGHHTRPAFTAVKMRQLWCKYQSYHLAHIKHTFVSSRQKNHLYAWVFINTPRHLSVLSASSYIWPITNEISFLTTGYYTSLLSGTTRWQTRKDNRQPIKLTENFKEGVFQSKSNPDTVAEKDWHDTAN